jgi:alkaline phosphatase
MKPPEGAILMKIRVFLSCALLIVLVIAACNVETSEPVSVRTQEPARNIILLIGDGMGPEVVGLAKEYARVIADRELWLEQTADNGRLALVDVAPQDALVTDSAAAGTALATGSKTANTLISMDPRGNPLPTILELARKDARSTGLISTARITHATPACFAAHIDHRNLENEIAEQMLAAGVDVMLGGGMSNWIPQGTLTSDIAKYAGRSKREDDRNLVEEAKQAGYRIVTSGKELNQAGRPDKMLGLFAASHIPYVLDRHADDGADIPSLPEMTEAAIEILSKNEKGFFLMVEGARIDHAAHANDVASMLADMLEFDDAVGVACGFAKEHPDTLVLVTADHATGASCLSARYSDEEKRTVYPTQEHLRKIAQQDASFEGILLPLMKGPSIERLKELVLQHTGIELSDEDAAFVMKMEPLSPFHVIKPVYRRVGGYAPLALGRVLGVHYGTSWGTGEHFAVPVMLVGTGAGADLVHGYLDNTDVFDIMKTAGEL